MGSRQEQELQASYHFIQKDHQLHVGGASIST
jgi:hypothetical protein